MDFYVPDLCRVRAVFMLLVTTELLALLFALVRARSGVDWDYFGLASLFGQWVVLTSAALICLLRRFLAKFRLPLATLLVLAVIQLDTLLFSLLADHMLDWLSGRDKTDWQGLLQHQAIALIIGLTLLRYFYLQHRWQQQRQSELLANLGALQARIQPHFLFNSMNTIASLIASRPDAAEEAVLDLAELFRASLRAQDRLISLADELALCRRYLRIEALRLGDRLALDWIVDEALAKQAIPPLTLQPLLENAIAHGIAARPAGGTLRLQIERKRDDVYMLVQNPVANPPAAGDLPVHSGNRMAFDNTRERLQAIFGEAAVLKQSQLNGLYTVTLRIPWRPLQ